MAEELYRLYSSTGEIAVHLAVAGGVYDSVFLCCPLFHEMSWMRSLTSLSQFLRVFLPTL